MRRGIVALLVAVFVTTSVSPATALTCTVTEIVAGLCSVGGGTNGTDVDVWVDGRTPGGASDDPSSVDCTETAEGRCVGVSPPKTVDKPETVHDLETFRPRRPRQFSEPAGWAIVSLPINFVSNARSHVVTGKLSGHAVEVRFVPVHYRRTFGDGSIQSTTVRGARWSTAWSSTDTSHVYRGTGLYDVGLLVTYVVDYRYVGLDWVRLRGTVSRAAQNLTVHVVGANTVLVAGSCSPGAIGC